MKQKKIKILLTIAVFIIFLVSVIFISTFAYFTSLAADDKEVDTTLLSGTTDELIFKAGEPIDLLLNVDNFGKGAGNVSGQTTAQAILVANNTTNTATMGYNVYFILDNNTFIYTTPDEKAEIVLKVMKPDGTKVESITGLKKTDLGFDITTRSGAFLVAKNYEITGNPRKIDDWIFEVIFINLDSNQNDNTGRSLSGKVYMTKDDVETYKLPEINNGTVSAKTSSTITVDMDITKGTEEIVKHYYAIVDRDADAPLENDYIEYNDTTHTFTGLIPEKEYDMYAYLIDEKNNRSVIYKTNITAGPYILPTIENVTKTSNELTSLTVSVAAINGEANISKYYYSKDNGQTYVESGTSVYTFNNLSENTQYNIKVKVKDVNNKYSTEYAVSLSTREYKLPVISTITLNTTYNSIAATAAITPGEANVSKYLFTIDNWATSKESVTNTYTFAGLTENNSYTVKVKAVDSNSRTSVEKTTTGKTNVYVLPKVTNVALSSTINTITVTATAVNGTGTVATYYYSKDNGVSYSPSNKNTYTFNGLTPGTTYNIKVKVKDNNNRESTEMLKSIATKPYVNPTASSLTISGASTTSLTATLNATAGSSSLKTYYFSNNNGASYVSTTSKSYTFSNLNSGTTYNIKAYVVDTTGKSSSVLSQSAATTYINPTASSISVTSSSTSSISLRLSASAGSGEISRYYFSKNGGSSYVSSSSSYYTFSQLSSGSRYNFSGYVVDVNGKSSSVVSTYGYTDDPYEGPTAYSVSVTSETSSSISVSVSASVGDGSSLTYYYSIGSGGYSSTSSSSKTFTGLNADTSYSIRVYVKDNNGYTSNTVYTTGKTATAYVPPTPGGSVSLSNSDHCVIYTIIGTGRGSLSCTLTNSNDSSQKEYYSYSVGSSSGEECFSPTITLGSTPSVYCTLSYTFSNGTTDYDSIRFSL